VSIVSRFLQGGRGTPSAGDLTIEPMRRRHLKGVMAIEEQVYPRPWTQGVFVSEMEQVRRGQREYLVASAGSRVVGYGGLMLLPEEAHITNIAVDPAEQRRGVGRRLMVALSRAARANGAESMSLEVRVSNVAAQEMYRAFGYVPAGVRQKYYENVEDAIVMWVHDVDTAAYDALLRSMEKRG
jgi:ribosomal-protein-alanine N-acetyltransferase